MDKIFEVITAIITIIATIFANRKRKERATIETREDNEANRIVNTENEKVFAELRCPIQNDDNADISIIISDKWEINEISSEEIHTVFTAKGGVYVFVLDSRIPSAGSAPLSHVMRCLRIEKLNKGNLGANFGAVAASGNAGGIYTSSESYGGVHVKIHGQIKPERSTNEL